jgi:signal peptidase II
MSGVPGTIGSPSQPVVTRVSLRVAVLLAMAGTIGCDRITKHLAAATLAGTPARSFLGDTLRLDYAENPGAFLGLGAEWPPELRAALFTAAAFVGLFVVAGLGRQLRHRPAALVGLALFAAGSLSNLVDRVTYGSVVDFLNVGVGPLRTGIFNVADVAILAGAALVVASSQRRHRPYDPPAV